MQDLVFLGAGTAFYEIFDLIQDINRQGAKYKIIAILDDNEETHGKELNGVRIEGNLGLAKKYSNAKFIFGIGSIKTRTKREKIIDNLGISREQFVTLIHPQAKIYSSALIGHGCILHCGCVVSAYSKLEDFVVMTFNSIVGAHTKIGRCSMIGPSVSILNNVKIGRQVFIGTGSVVGDKVTVGDSAVIGIGSVVPQNVKDNAFVLGNPARFLGKANEWIRA